MVDGFDKITDEKISADLNDAYDFDPKDPLFGLSKQELSGPKLNRRSMLRLMAASGALTMYHLLNVGRAVEVFGQSGGHLNAAWSTAEFDTLLPQDGAQAVMFKVTSNIFGGLVHYDKDLISRADLATDWTTSADGLQWTFNLREGVTFHNGDAFTADDVLFTFNFTKGSSLSNASRLDLIESIEKLDDFTVKMTLTKPSASFLTFVMERSSGRAFAILNERALGELGQAGYALTPVGNGPFRVVEHVLGERLELEKFENFYNPELPKLDTVTIFNIEEPDTRVSALEAGDVDFIDVVPEQFVDRVLGNPDLATSSTAGPGFQSLIPNHARAPWGDRRARLAIAKAVDRREFIQKALFGRGVAGYASIPPAQGAFFVDLSETSPQRFDPDRARELWAELKEDGVIDDNFRPSILISTGAARRAEILQSILKKQLDLDVDIEVVDFPVQVQRVLRDRDFDLTQLGSGGDLDPDDSLNDWFQTNSRLNSTGYSSAQADIIIDAQSAELDLVRRIELVQRASGILSNDVAHMFLFHPIEFVGFSSNLEGFVHIPGLADLDTVTFA